MNLDEEIAFNEELLDKVSQVPSLPGVYQYFNAQSKIIYVGKAKNLRNRVRSYFHSIESKDAKTKALLSKIADIEIIIVDSEAEALILEDNLIKKHKPRYNILLKDDKTYPFIKITKEPYPRIFITRNVVKDGSKYLGPFTEVRAIKYLLKSVRNIFQIRSCKYPINDDIIKRGKIRPCLDYHIGKCQAPCIGKIGDEEYNDNIKMAYQVLLGKTKNLSIMLERQMSMHSENEEFEKAAKIRDKLQSLGDFTSKQKVIAADGKDRDIFGIARSGNYACTLVFIVRDGKLISKRHFIIVKAELEENDVLLQRTLEKYYLESEFVPRELVLPNEVAELEYILDWLVHKRDKILEAQEENLVGAISVIIPKVGDKRKLVEMANTNANFLLKEYLLSLDKRDKAVPHSIVALQRDLNLNKLPRRIECYDNSHLQGTNMVSSMVVFIDGKPMKSEYRKFKAKDDYYLDNNESISQKLILHNDDFAMMRETIYRRFKRAVDENQPLPDLVIVDGGKGQLSSAYSILTELNLDKSIAIIGLAKRLEEVFTPNNSLPIMLPKTSSSLKLIQQLRDEAHRFAITFHRQLRDKTFIESELMNIKGIGKETIKKLVDKFGSVQQIKKQNDEELLKVLSQGQLSSLRSKFPACGEEGVVKGE